jgi:hypothetical protein
MLRDCRHLEMLSRQYEIPEIDILLIALNTCGLRSAEPRPRARFRFFPNGYAEDPVYLILPFNRPQSPFLYRDQQVYFDGKVVGRIDKLENDDVVQAYFRNAGRNLTLNSNARSQCVGCAFCYNILEEPSDPRIRGIAGISDFFDFISADMGWSDLRSVEKITVSTGCFYYEDRAISHMSEIGHAASKFGFAGELHLLSSVVRGGQAYKRIAEELAPFHITLTIECFTNRDLVLKKTKADFAFDAMLATLCNASSAGLRADFCYIVGLDPLDVALTGTLQLAACANTFPRLQIFQAHNPYMEVFRSADAGELDYYLKFRKGIEAVYTDRGLRPKSWENYRPLWYYSFADEPMRTVRI